MWKAAAMWKLLNRDYNRISVAYKSSSDFPAIPLKSSRDWKHVTFKREKMREEVFILNNPMNFLTNTIKVEQVIDMSV